MLRITNALSRFLYHNKIIRLDLNKKKNTEDYRESGGVRKVPLS
jgi:hypothetical protein